MLSTATVSPDMGVFSLLLLLIISIFVTSLCSSCARSVGQTSVRIRKVKVKSVCYVWLKVGNYNNLGYLKNMYVCFPISSQQRLEV
jgi:hypothetical protein